MDWISENIPLLLEWSGLVFGLLYIFFATRNNQWCWPIGIVSSTLSIWLFYEYAQLYSEAILSLYYVVMGFYGWWAWQKQDQKKNSSNDSSKSAIHSMTYQQHALMIIIGTLGSFALYYFIGLIWVDAQKPLFDAFTTVFSFLATWLTAKRLLENWIYWVIIDFVSVFLYISRDLYFYAALMGLYSVIAAYGYINWKKKMQKA